MVNASPKDIQDATWGWGRGTTDYEEDTRVLAQKKKKTNSSVREVWRSGANGGGGDYYYSDGTAAYDVTHRFPVVLRTHWGRTNNGGGDRLTRVYIIETTRYGIVWWNNSEPVRTQHEYRSVFKCVIERKFEYISLASLRLFFV